MDLELMINSFPKLLNATVFTKKGFVIGKIKDGIYTKESIK